jgi:hypothetical protein
MAWSAPMTAVANTIFTAAQFNTHVRDNLNETAPAKATLEGQLFTASGTNAIVARRPTFSIISTIQTTSSVAYTDLATVGPTLTVTTGTRAIVMINAGISNDTLNGASYASLAVSGASAIAASDSFMVASDGFPANNVVRYGITHMFNSLTAGSNTFTMKYRAGSGIAEFRDRVMVLVHL